MIEGVGEDAQASWIGCRAHARSRQFDGAVEIDPPHCNTTDKRHREGGPGITRVGKLPEPGASDEHRLANGQNDEQQAPLCHVKTGNRVIGCAAASQSRQRKAEVDDESDDHGGQKPQSEPPITVSSGAGQPQDTHERIPNRHPNEHHPERVGEADRQEAENRSAHGEDDDRRGEQTCPFPERFRNRGSEHQTNECRNEHRQPDRPRADVEVVRDPRDADPARPHTPKQRKRLQRTLPAERFEQVMGQLRDRERVDQIEKELDRLYLAGMPS